MKVIINDKTIDISKKKLIKINSKWSAFEHSYSKFDVIKPLFYIKNNSDTKIQNALSYQDYIKTMQDNNLDNILKALGKSINKFCEKKENKSDNICKLIKNKKIQKGGGNKSFKHHIVTFKSIRPDEDSKLKQLKQKFKMIQEAILKLKLNDEKPANEENQTLLKKVQENNNQLSEKNNQLLKEVKSKEKQLLEKVKLEDEQLKNALEEKEKFEIQNKLLTKKNNQLQQTRELLKEEVKLADRENDAIKGEIQNYFLPSLLTDIIDKKKEFTDEYNKLDKTTKDAITKLEEEIEEKKESINILKQPIDEEDDNGDVFVMDNDEELKKLEEDLEQLKNKLNELQGETLNEITKELNEYETTIKNALKDALKTEFDIEKLGKINKNIDIQTEIEKLKTDYEKEVNELKNKLSIIDNNENENIRRYEVAEFRLEETNDKLNILEKTNQELIKQNAELSAEQVILSNRSEEFEKINTNLIKEKAALLRTLINNDDVTYGKKKETLDKTLREIDTRIKELDVKNNKLEDRDKINKKLQTNLNDARSRIQTLLSNREDNPMFSEDEDEDENNLPLAQAQIINENDIKSQNKKSLKLVEIDNIENINKKNERRKKRRKETKEEEEERNEKKEEYNELLNSLLDTINNLTDENSELQMNNEELRNKGRLLKEAAERESKEAAERESKEAAERESKEAEERERKEAAERESKEAEERERKEEAIKKSKEAELLKKMDSDLILVLWPFTNISNDATNATTIEKINETMTDVNNIIKKVKSGKSIRIGDESFQITSSNLDLMEKNEGYKYFIPKYGKPDKKYKVRGFVLEKDNILPALTPDIKVNSKEEMDTQITNRLTGNDSVLMKKIEIIMTNDNKVEKIFIPALGKSGTGKTYSLLGSNNDHTHSLLYNILNKMSTVLNEKVLKDAIKKKVMIDINSYEFSAFHQNPHRENIYSPPLIKLDDKIVKAILNLCSQAITRRVTYDTTSFAKRWSELIPNNKFTGGIPNKILKLSNKGNEQSSRTELVITIELIIPSTTKRVKLYIIDPAGKEYIAYTNTIQKWKKDDDNTIKKWEKNKRCSLYKQMYQDAGFKIVSEKNNIPDQKCQVTRPFLKNPDPVFPQNLYNLIAAESHFINISLRGLKYMMLSGLQNPRIFLNKQFKNDKTSTITDRKDLFMHFKYHYNSDSYQYFVDDITTDDERLEKTGEKYKGIKVSRVEKGSTNSNINMFPIKYNIGNNNEITSSGGKFFPFHFLKWIENEMYDEQSKPSKYSVIALQTIDTRSVEDDDKNLTKYELVNTLRILRTKSSINVFDKKVDKNGKKVDLTPENTYTFGYNSVELKDVELNKNTLDKKQFIEKYTPSVELQTISTTGGRINKKNRRTRKNKKSKKNKKSRRNRKSR